MLFVVLFLAQVVDRLMQLWSVHKQFLLVHLLLILGRSMPLAFECRGARANQLKTEVHLRVSRRCTMLCSCQSCWYCTVYRMTLTGKIIASQWAGIRTNFIMWYTKPVKKTFPFSLSYLFSRSFSKIWTISFQLLFQFQLCEHHCVHMSVVQNTRTFWSCWLCVAAIDLLYSRCDRTPVAVRVCSPRAHYIHTS